MSILSSAPPPWSFVFLELKSTLASGCRIRLEASLGSRHGTGSGGGGCGSCRHSWVRAELERPVTDLGLQVGDLFRLKNKKNTQLKSGLNNPLLFWDHLNETGGAKYLEGH